jgi:hypothetical protein
MFTFNLREDNQILYQNTPNGSWGMLQIQPVVQPLLMRPDGLPVRVDFRGALLADPGVEAGSEKSTNSRWGYSQKILFPSSVG